MKNFDELGIMIDCSRNGVMKPEAVRDYIRIMAKMGYTYLMLYTEDTYEVEGEPYFGYLRGRYTCEEMRELDEYAAEQGIELIPCVQALAHLNSIMRWEEYASQARDFDNILLIGAERTYTLLANMFKTLRKCFRTKRIHLGMDEAYMVGLGKYRELHGIRNRFEILTEHLNRVCELAAKEGFEPMIWNDMFYHLSRESGMVESAKAMIPKDVTLVYWDYYRSTEAEYAKFMHENKQLCDNLIFAGGAWCWHGFAPHNKFSIHATREAFAACVKEGVRSAFITLWGDDGAEGSRYSVLPTMAWAACLAQNENATEEDVKALFRDAVGDEYDDYMLLDIPNRISAGSGDRCENPSKYLLYNDPLAGFLDYTVPAGVAAACAESAARLAEAGQRVKHYPEVFRTLSALCSVLEIKADLGVRTQDAYLKGDREAVLRLAQNDYPEAIRRVETFSDLFYDQWMAENKPYGFDVQDIRLGGLKERLRRAANRLVEWAEGKVGSIPELEEERLPVQRAKAKGESIGFNVWAQASTVCRLSHP